jgi:hypothetical protein
MNSNERIWLSGAIGPLTDGIAAAPQVEPESEAARALDELIRPERRPPDDVELQALIARIESS